MFAAESLATSMVLGYALLLAMIGLLALAVSRATKRRRQSGPGREAS
jgi:hypothetical protein